MQLKTSNYITFLHNLSFVRPTSKFYGYDGSLKQFIGASKKNMLRSKNVTNVTIKSHLNVPEKDVQNIQFFIVILCISSLKQWQITFQ